MAKYRLIGSRNATAKADTTGRNAGNWTVTFSPDVLLAHVALFEIYHVAIDGPVGSSFKVFRENDQWDQVLQGWQNSWDPGQPMMVRDADTLYYFWASATSTSPTPTVTLWLRYDADLPENQQLG